MTSGRKNSRTSSWKARLVFLEGKLQAARNWRNESFFEKGKLILKKQPLVWDLADARSDLQNAKKAADGIDADDVGSDESAKILQRVEDARTKVRGLEKDLANVDAKISQLLRDIKEAERLIADYTRQIEEHKNTFEASIDSDEEHTALPSGSEPLQVREDLRPGIKKTNGTEPLDPLDQNIFHRASKTPDLPSPNTQNMIGDQVDGPAPDSIIEKDDLYNPNIRGQSAMPISDPLPSTAIDQLSPDLLTELVQGFDQGPIVSDAGNSTISNDAIVDKPIIDFTESARQKFEDDFVLPVLLDLDGDGIEIVPLGHSRAKFDINSNGRRQHIAWVAPDDGLLVYDRDNDQVISHKDEIAFRDYLDGAKTDLEGLAWFDQFDQGGNEDGVLDARDAMWKQFGIWRDIDQDGQTDPGELQMTEGGDLKSIKLHSDGEETSQGPDAWIYGKTEITLQDSDEGINRLAAYDAALRYAHEPEGWAHNTFPVNINDRMFLTRYRKDRSPLTTAEILYPRHYSAANYDLGLRVVQQPKESGWYIRMK